MPGKTLGEEDELKLPNDGSAPVLVLEPLLRADARREPDDDVPDTSGMQGLRHFLHG